MSLKDVLDKHNASSKVSPEESSRWEDIKHFTKWSLLGGPAGALAAVPVQKTGNEAADKVQRVIKALGVGTHAAMPQSLITDYLTDDKASGDFEAEGIPENVAQVIGALGGSIPTFGIAGAAVTKAAKAAKVGSALTKGLKVGSKVIPPAIIKPAAILGLLEGVKKTDEDESRLQNIVTGVGTGAAMGAIGAKVAPKISAFFKKKLGIDITDEQAAAFNKSIGNPNVRAKEAAVMAKALNKPNLAQYINNSPELSKRLSQFTTKVGGKAPIIGRSKKGIGAFVGEGVELNGKVGAGYRKSLNPKQMSRLRREIIVQDRERLLGKTTVPRAAFTKLEKWMNPSDRQALEASRGNQPQESTNLIQDTHMIINRAHDQGQTATLMRGKLLEYMKKVGITEARMEELTEAVSRRQPIKMTPVEGKAVKEFWKITNQLHGWEKEAGVNVAYKKFYKYGKTAESKIPTHARSGKPKPGKSKASFEYKSKEIVEDKLPAMQGLEDRIKAHTFRMLQTNGKDWDKSIMFYKAQGAKAKADSMVSLYSDITGVSKEAINNTMKQDFVRNGVYAAEDALKNMGLERQSLSDEVYKHLTELMYNSWLGTSAGIIVKQAAFQLPNVGGVELTPTYLMRGIQHLAKKTPMYREAFARNFHRMAPTDTIDFAEQAANAAKSKMLPKYVEQTVKALTILPRKTTMKGFMKLDKFWNRQVAFNGGMSRFMDTGGDVAKVTEITQNLWPAQRRALLQTLKDKGLQAAAEDYGVLKSLRVNYMYFVGDKPDMLRGEIGKYIPFTTWTRNQWMRFMGDAVNDPLSLAERVGYPAAFTAMVAGLTGIEVPRSEPVTSLAGVSMTPAPMISNVAEELGMGNFKQAGKEAMSIFPVANAYNRAERIQKKGLLKGMSMRKAKTVSLADLFK